MKYTYSKEMTMITKRYLLSILLLSAGLFAQTATADTLGFRAGTGIWQPDSSGTFRHGASGTDIDLKDDLYLKDEDQQYTYALLEHPIPLIPNVKISQTTLSSEGTGTSNFTFAGTDYTGIPVTTEMVLDHSDVTVYWQLLDNWINIDFGLTARKFDGKLAVTNTASGITEQTNIDKTIPMLYLAAGIEPPFIEDLFIGVEANLIDVNGNNISDITAKISYTTSYLVGFEAGVRTFIVELDDVGGNSSNMEFTGSFANLYIHF